jgi:hypothetical protein
MQWHRKFKSNASKAVTLETITFAITSSAQLFAAQLFKEIRNSIKILYRVSFVLSNGIKLQLLSTKNYAVQLVMKFWYKYSCLFKNILFSCSELKRDLFHVKHVDKIKGIAKCVFVACSDWYPCLENIHLLSEFRRYKGIRFTDESVEIKTYKNKVKLLGLIATRKTCKLTQSKHAGRRQTAKSKQLWLPSGNVNKNC